LAGAFGPSNSDAGDIVQVVQRGKGKDKKNANIMDSHSSSSSGGIFGDGGQNSGGDLNLILFDEVNTCI
jgi:hypothetical protein